MKLAIDANHRDFFNKNRLIEFEGLFTPSKTAELLLHTESAAKEKIQSARIPIQKVAPEQYFESGRDLWRVDDYLRKIESSPQICEVVSELVEQRPIRLGYDQYIPVIPLPKVPIGELHYYHRFLQTNASLSEIACIEGLLGAFMICLKGDGTQHASTIFSSTPGNAVFFGPHLPISFSDLYQRIDHRYLMVVYTTTNASYIFQENAPHCHEFKHIGYSFGDKLIDKWNPIVFR